MSAVKIPAPPPAGGVRNPRELPFTPGRSRGRLPHLEKQGCTYFVTFCLAGTRITLPDATRANESMTPAEVFRLSEPSRSRDGLLWRPDLAQNVESSLLHFQEERFALHAWAVLPDHVHVVVTPWTHTLTKIVHSWKSFSANRINMERRKKGGVWQAESFDHVVRSNGDFERFVEYVERNPVEAGLCDEAALWGFGSARWR